VGSYIDSLRDGATHKQRIKQMQTFMLVMTIFSTGQNDDIALGFQLSYHDCSEIAATIEPVLSKDAADIFCEIEGVSE
jgi:hypothetical protein